jgi:hypothetical protein
MASTSNTKKRKRSKKPGYDQPFNYDKVAWLLLGLLLIGVLAMRHFNW